MERAVNINQHLSSYRLGIYTAVVGAYYDLSMGGGTIVCVENSGYLTRAMFMLL